MVLSRYVAVVPILGMDLHLLKFGKGYSWFRIWDDLQGLNGKTVNQQIKLIVPQEDVKQRPAKFYVCTLIDAETEESAYEQGLNRIEEFVFLSNIYLRRSFRLLLYETVILPMPKTQSISDISLTVEKERIKRIMSPLETWTIEVPYFGEITKDDIYAAHFEITDIQANIAEKVSVIGKQKWLDFEKEYKRLTCAKTDQKEILIVIGQLYASANSVETVALSYMMLWEILEAYCGTDKGRESLLLEETLGKIRELLKQESCAKEGIQTAVDTLRGLKKETLTQQMARIIHAQIFPDKNQSDVFLQLRDIRNTRNSLTHPTLSKKVTEATILNHYQQLREIVDSLIVNLTKH